MNKYLTEVGALALIVILALAGRADASEGSAKFLAASGKPVITLSQLHGMIVGETERPVLRIFSSGRVRVDLPTYMKGAGSYEYQLDHTELGAVLVKLESLGLMTVNTEALVLQRDALARAQVGEQFATLDSTLTRIDIAFDRYALTGQKSQPLSKTIEWADMGVEAERFSGLIELGKLNEARVLLLELTKHQNYNAIRVLGGQ